MTPLPYCGAPALPEDVWLRWNTDPVLLAALPLLAMAHFVLARPAGPRPITCFLGAWGLLAIVFISPFCALASALFAVRTLHHVLLVTAVAPLLVLAGGAGARRGPGAVPLALLHAMILWAWHAPAAYALALADTTIYWLMQAALLSSAVALWRTVLAPAAPIGAALAALALTLAQTGLLGALLTFARAPLYAFHHATTWPWGLSPLADQQLAGALMWTLGALPYLAAALALVASRLAPSDPAAPEAAR